jgi:uncharacterized protein YkwD
MKKFIIICLSLVLLSQAKATPSKAQTILADINAYRVEHELPQLKMNDVLTREAVKHSREMAQNIIPFGHEGFGVRAHHITEQFKHIKSIAENVAYTDLANRSVVKLWLNSPGHRKNIEGNYNLTGIGIASDKTGRVYVTQIFLKI